MTKTEFIIEPGRQDIIMTRIFDAPRDLVFSAVTDPKLVPKWWGPASHETVVERDEVEAGGRWRYVSRDTDGNELGFAGVYHDIVTSERIVRTSEFYGVPGHVSLETLTLEDLDGKTKYVSVAVFQSVEDRDGVVQSGMESGANETMDRLAELLESL